MSKSVVIRRTILAQYRSWLCNNLQKIQTNCRSFLCPMRFGVPDRLRFSNLAQLERAAAPSVLSQARFEHTRNRPDVLLCRLNRLFEAGFEAEDPETRYILLSRVEPLGRIVLRRVSYDNKWMRPCLEDLIQLAKVSVSQLRLRLSNCYNRTEKYPKQIHSGGKESTQSSDLTKTLYRMMDEETGMVRNPRPPVMAEFGPEMPENEPKSQMRIGVLTVSDSCAKDPSKDKSGPALVDALKEYDTFKEATFKTDIVDDDLNRIQTKLRTWTSEMDLVLTTGGTGFAPRDVTPEATRALIERPCPGLVVALIQEGLKHTPMAALSRPEAGIRGNCLLVNLPGSPRACAQSVPVLAQVLGHGLRLLHDQDPHPASAE